MKLAIYRSTIRKINNTLANIPFTVMPLVSNAIPYCTPFHCVHKRWVDVMHTMSRLILKSTITAPAIVPIMLLLFCLTKTQLLPRCLCNAAQAEFSLSSTDYLSLMRPISVISDIIILPHTAYCWKLRFLSLHFCRRPISRSLPRKLPNSVMQHKITAITSSKVIQGH